MMMLYNGSIPLITYVGLIYVINGTLPSYNPTSLGVPHIGSVLFKYIE